MAELPHQCEPCGRSFSHADDLQRHREVVHGDPKPGGAPSKSPNNGAKVLIAAVVAVAFVVFFALSATDEANDPPPPNNTSASEADTSEDIDWDVVAFTAEDVCHDAVESKLKAPATAEFSGNRFSQGQGNRWSMMGAVDSENGFGAMLRAAWVCAGIVDGDIVRVESAEVIEQ